MKADIVIKRIWPHSEIKSVAGIYFAQFFNCCDFFFEIFKPLSAIINFTIVDYSLHGLIFSFLFLH